MELKRHLEPKTIFIGLYFLAFLVYLIYGLQPAGATHYEIASEIRIPRIGLSSPVTQLTLDGSKLDTPDSIVGSYSEHTNKTLLIGHSTTAFEGLDQIKLRDKIEYGGEVYKVITIGVLQKAQIDMEEILADAERPTLIVMTCAGELLGDGDATHRLIVTAIQE